MTMVNDLLAHLLGYIRNIVIVLLSDPIQQVQRVILAEMPMKLWRRAQAYEYTQNRNDQLPLGDITRLITHFLEVRKDTAFCTKVVARHVQLVVDVREIVIDGLFSKLDEARDAFSVQDGTM